MGNDAFKLRVVVAQESGSSWPTIVGAISEDTWAIIPPEEWDSQKRDMAQKWLGPDWGGYDMAEAVVHLPIASLQGLFAPPIAALRVEAADV